MHFPLSLPTVTFNRSQTPDPLVALKERVNSGEAVRKQNQDIMTYLDKQTPPKPQPSPFQSSPDRTFQFNRPYTRSWDVFAMRDLGIEHDRRKRSK